MENSKIECVESKVTAEGLQYGRFVVEPLERGYGITLGNALRRVLLSSLEGSAITAVRFEEVSHEFSTLPGVSEDVLDIILNLKNVVFKYHGTEPREVKLVAKKVGAVTASDIKGDAELEVINPDSTIATVTDKSGGFTAILTVEKGKGYQTAAPKAKHSKAIGEIAIDAVFAPVRRVNYTVEETRVGMATDLDKLILEVWTNGSISPAESITRSAVILRDQLDLFTTISEEGTKKKPAASAVSGASITNELMEMSVEGLDLSQRAKNCLKRAKIDTIKKLVAKSEEDLLAIKNFGEKSATEIREKLEAIGLSLKPSSESKDEE